MARETGGGRHVFPLSTVDGLLAQLRLPAGKLTAAGNWSAEYGIFATSRRCIQSGTLKIRKTADGGAAAMQVQIRKAQPDGHVQRIAGRLKCRADQLSTPTQWQFHSEILSAGKKPVRHTKVQATAAVRGGKLVFKGAGGRKPIALPGPYTLSWALFDAVGRLPRKAFKPIPFDLIDDFDQFKAGQTLAFRASQAVTIGKRQVRLHAFDHFGRGILPWTYFVTDGGLVVVAVSGLKAYGILGTGRARGGGS